MATKADILTRLRQDILSLQGCRTPMYSSDLDVNLGPVKEAFPNSIFPVAAIHEFVCTTAENIAASAGFISGILSALVKDKRPFIWISKDKNIFPPALIH